MKGEVVEEEKWGQRSSGWKRSKRSKEGGHIFGHLFWPLSPPQVTRWPLHPKPEVTQDSSTARDHLLSNCVCTHKKMFYFCLSTHFFSLLFFSWLFLHIFLGGDLWFQNGRSNPRGTLCVIKGRQGLWRHYRKTTWPFVCVFVCVCVCAWVRVCGMMRAWMCGCVELHTSILYNTASAICHRGELTHELNRDKEQIYLKQLRYILWTTVKHSFLLNPKKWT